MTEATSASVPILLKVCIPVTTARPSSVLVKFDMSVSMTPGAMALTRMPRRPSAAAKYFTSVLMAPRPRTGGEPVRPVRRGEIDRVGTAAGGADLIDHRLRFIGIATTMHDDAGAGGGQRGGAAHSARSAGDECGLIGELSQPALRFSLPHCRRTVGNGRSNEVRSNDFSRPIREGEPGGRTQRPPASFPGQEHTNVAGHSIGKIDDLNFEPVAARAEMLMP